MSNTTSMQQRIISGLEAALIQHDCEPTIVAPWRPFKGAGRKIYQPAIDVAAGPYAIGGLQYESEYDASVNQLGPLIATWIRQFKRNWKIVVGERYWITTPAHPSTISNFNDADSNKNARCFIAIEFENENSRKHIMGSIVNVGALGRIGILVAEQDKVLRAAIRMRAYFDYLQEVHKRTFNMSTVLILTDKQLLRSLQRIARHH
jgi:hypothetical protein